MRCSFCRMRGASRTHNIVVLDADLTFQISVLEPDVYLCLECKLAALQIWPKNQLGVNAVLDVEPDPPLEIGVQDVDAWTGEPK